MLTRSVQSWLLATVRLPDPWTRTVGLARSLIALEAALTYLLTPSTILFLPAKGALGIRCHATISMAAWPCWLPESAVQFTQWVVGAACLLIAAGFLPFLTAIPLALMLLALSLVSAAPDGGDQLAAIIGLLLLPVSLLDWRVHWWSSRRLVAGTRVRSLLANTGLVLIKVQVSVVYFVACVGKFGSVEWADGTALFYWVRNNVFGAPAFLRAAAEWVTSIPLFVASLTWGTLVLEFLLAICLWLPSGFRTKVLLPTAFLFHLGIWLVLGISSFAVVMWAALLMLVIPLGKEIGFREAAARQQAVLKGSVRD